MTLTFKDPNGVEWALRAHRVDYGDSRFAEPADLLSALGQLSTGSDGPTDEFLLDIQATNAPAYRRALFAAGLALGEQKLKAQGWRHVPDTHEVIPKGRHEWVLKSDLDAAKAEVDRLTTLVDIQADAANTFQNQRDAAESELAATKAKLAEVERLCQTLDDGRIAMQQERDGWSKLAHEARSELASARRVVEAAKRGDGYRRDWDHVATYYDMALSEWGRGIELTINALASAGADADRTTTGADLALQGIGMLREAEFGIWARARMSAELKALLVATWELVVAVTQNKADWIAEARTKAETAARAGDALLDEIATAEKSIRKGTDADRTEARPSLAEVISRVEVWDEPPRPEAGELRCEYCNMREHAYSKGGRCYGSLSRMHSFDEPKLTPGAIASTIVAIADSLPTAEPKPEPQPDAPLPLPWRLEFDGTLWSVMSADGQHVADDLREADARRIVERCGQEEPQPSGELVAAARELLEEYDLTLEELRNELGMEKDDEELIDSYAKAERLRKALPCP